MFVSHSEGGEMGLPKSLMALPNPVERASDDVVDNTSAASRVHKIGNR